MYNRSIEFTKNTVIKFDDPKLMRIQVEKSRRAYAISKNSNLFRVPEVLDYNDDKGVAVFERIIGIRPIQSTVSFVSDYTNIAGILGASLAVIHRELTLPSEMIIPLPTEFSGSDSDVIIHGDLSTYMFDVRTFGTD